ncbi:MAG TPA: YbdK family carboxylate-amine ligase [Solirubrobacteraceae bacterium]|nr:YbdK family carboxylate-amine ligase [Solirubrobacteraceae bacterium]
MHWARWSQGAGRPYTIGVEEEVMLLDSSDHSLVPSSESVLGRLPDELSKHTSLETHASVIELATGIHSDVAGAVAELTSLRGQLARELRQMGLAAASAGTYPLARLRETHVSQGARYRGIADSMRFLALRDPTFALHIHIGVPDPDNAIRLLNGLRDAVPLLLALSANSPFCQGRDSGFASARTMIFQGFPRTGTARPFSGYTEYIDAVDALIASGALPDPSYLWWDVRLQPVLGTVEVRVMDAQTTVGDTAALLALVHALARLQLEGEPLEGAIAPEVLAENRFLAARDGLDARLIDPVKRRLVPARVLLDALLARCRAHTDAVGSVELDRIMRLVAANGADRQRSWARNGGIAEVASMLTQRFGAPSGRLVSDRLAHSTERSFASA